VFDGTPAALLDAGRPAEQPCQGDDRVAAESPLEAAIRRLTRVGPVPAGTSDD
jgi:hypothetical protein